ncbi:hypothetical protein WJX75_000727 [Coccomyxa subellipsoidea]|uniref:Uncharacterized protein n=1 Tax=Coccomyxa subellipsoidea TaxID=248742 RepID=A0ABR2Z309_9CHLO
MQVLGLGATRRRSPTLGVKVAKLGEPFSTDATPDASKKLTEALALSRRERETARARVLARRRERRSFLRSALASNTGIAIVAGLCVGSIFAVIIAAILEK